MRLIDADTLYERLRDDEDLARQRVIDTPNSFPNGMLNPAAVRYMAQLSERTRIKEIVYDAPTIEPERKTGKWIKKDCDLLYCSECDLPSLHPWPYCERCGAKMDS